MTHIFHTKHISKNFGGIVAADKVSVTFKPGEITGLIGPNGSGKSTLINLITGLKEMDGGSIVVEGQDIPKIQPFDIATYGITRTFQEVRLFEQLTVLDNILVTVTERNVSSALFEKHTEFHLKQAEEVLKKVSLWEKRDALAKELSYGQRKLLEIARVFGMNSQVIFFDEPFAGLFPEMVKLVASMLKELRTQGKTIVLVEHNVDLIRELCDHLIVMDAGKVLAEGDPHDVLQQKDVLEAYLGV